MHETTTAKMLKHLSKGIALMTAQMPHIKMLVLFGSRAREDSSEFSDWDFAVLYDDEQKSQNSEPEKGLDWLQAWSVLASAFQISEDDLDIVNLASCSALLAHCVATDGVLLYERKSGTFEEFCKKSKLSQEVLAETSRKNRLEVEKILQEFGVG